MTVGAVELKTVDLNGIAVEGASHSRADGVDDAGLRDDVVVHIERIQRTGIGEERILWMVVRRKEELAVDGSNRRLVDLVWLNPTNKASHTDLLVSGRRTLGANTRTVPRAAFNK